MAEDKEKSLEKTKEFIEKELKLQTEKEEGMLASERAYVEESLRIQKEKEEREYRQKLSEARTARAAQKIKTDWVQKQQDDANEAYLDSLKRAAEEEREILENGKDAAIRLVRERAEGSLSALSDLQNEQAKLEKKLAGEETLLRKVTIRGAGEHGEDMRFSVLSDPAREREQIEEYERLLTLLRARGASDALFQKVRSGTLSEGRTMAEELLGLSDAEFARYDEEFLLLKEAEERASKTLFEEETKALKEAFAREWDTLPEAFFELGGQSLSRFGDGFLADMQALISKVYGALSLGVLSLSAGGEAGAGTQNTYNTNYHFSGSRETVAEQLASAYAAATVNRLRGE